MSAHSSDVIENRTFDEMKVGDRAFLQKRLTMDDIKLFAIMSGDINPSHVDDDYAKSRTDSQKKYVEDIKPLQQEYSENSDKIRALYYEHKLSAGDTLKRLGELKKKYQEDVKQLQQKTDVPRQYAGMSNFMDLYDALGGGFFYGKNASTATGSYVPCSGHGSKYYSSYGNRNVELVANWGTLKMQNRKLVELFRKDKPEVAKALDEMLDDLLGRAKRLKRNGKS